MVRRGRARRVAAAGVVGPGGQRQPVEDQGKLCREGGVQLLLRIPLVDAAYLREGARDPEVDPACSRGGEGGADGQGEIEEGREGGEGPETAPREARREERREGSGRAALLRQARRVAPRDRCNP